MDGQINVQKRKRADTVPNTTAIPVELDPEETIVVDHPSFGLPSNIEDDPNDSDVDQPDNEELEKSTLFWSTQFVLSLGEDNEIGLEKPATEHHMKGVPNLLRESYTT
jgi:hypothetical protein